MKPYCYAFVTAAVVCAMAGLAFAGCATTAYSQACGECLGLDAMHPDKMDDSCYNDRISGASSCYSAAYPLMAAAYGNNNCSEVDACKAALTSCVDASKSASGNDRADCSAGTVNQCFVQGDACMAQANTACQARGQAAKDDIFAFLYAEAAGLCDPLFGLVLVPLFALGIAYASRR